jgi:hypothetical protein
MGINSFWRPCKHVVPDEDKCSVGHLPLLMISVFWVVFGACLPAFFLSATNQAVRVRVGVGCRSLTWIGIMALWLISFVSDSIARWCICRYSDAQCPVEDKLRKIWWGTVVKDTIVAVAVTALVLIVQIGRYNSCWCRMSFSRPPIVKLMGYTQSQWTTARVLWASIPFAGLAINLVLIMGVERYNRNSDGSIAWFTRQRGSPLCKSGKDIQEEWQELGVLRTTVDESREASEISVMTRIQVVHDEL